MLFCFLDKVCVSVLSFYMVGNDLILVTDGSFDYRFSNFRRSFHSLVYDVCSSGFVKLSSSDFDACYCCDDVNQICNETDWEALV